MDVKTKCIKKIHNDEINILPVNNFKNPDSPIITCDEMVVFYFVI